MPREQQRLGHPARPRSDASSLGSASPAGSLARVAGLDGPSVLATALQRPWRTRGRPARLRVRNVGQSGPSQQPKRAAPLWPGLELEEIGVKSRAEARRLDVPVWQKGCRPADGSRVEGATAGLSAACNCAPGSAAEARRWRGRDSLQGSASTRLSDLRFLPGPRESRASPARVPRESRAMPGKATPRHSHRGLGVWRPASGGGGPERRAAQQKSQEPSTLRAACHGNGSKQAAVARRLANTIAQLRLFLSSEPLRARNCKTSSGWLRAVAQRTVGSRQVADDCDAIMFRMRPAPLAQSHARAPPGIQQATSDLRSSNAPKCCNARHAMAAVSKKGLGIPHKPPTRCPAGRQALVHEGSFRSPLAARKARHGMAWRCVARGGVAWRGNARRGKSTQRSARQRNVKNGGAQSGAAQCCVAEHGAARSRLAMCGMALHAMARHGVARQSAGRQKAKRPGTAGRGAARRGPAKPSVAHRSIALRCAYGAAGHGAARRIAWRHDAACYRAEEHGRGVAWHLESPRSTAQRLAPLRTAPRDATALCRAAPRGAARHRKAPLGTAPHGSAPRCTARCGAARRGTARQGIAPGDTGRRGAGRRCRPRLSRHSAARHGAARSGTARRGTARHSIALQRNAIRRTSPRSIGSHCAAPQFTAPHPTTRASPCHTAPHHTAPRAAAPHYAARHCAAPHRAAPHRTEPRRHTAHRAEPHRAPPH